MSHKTRKLRLGALITMIFALAVGLVGISPASAITVDPGTGGNPQVFLASLTGPNEVYRALTDSGGDPSAQAAGSLFLGSVENFPGDLFTNPPTISGSHVVNGERLIIEVSDGLGGNCDSTGKFIGFASKPGVVVVSNTPGISVNTTLASSTATNRLRGSGLGCGAPFTPAQTDQLIITVTDAPPGGATVGGFLLTGVQYDVGSQAGVGNAVIRWASDVPPVDPTVPPAGTGDTGATFAVNSNAYITNLIVTPSAANAIKPGANRAVGDINFQETNFDATTPWATHNAVCVVLRAGGTGVHFVDPGTVAVTGGDTAGTPELMDNGNTIMIPFTGDMTKKSSFVLSGAMVNASFPGQVHFEVFQCDSSTGDATTEPNFREITNPGGVNGNNPTPDAGFHAGVDSYTREFPGQTNSQFRLLLTVVTSERFAGTNRNDTARIIGDRTFGCEEQAPGKSFVIVARNDDFADALAASYVAGQLYAPILLVNTHGAIPQETLDSFHFHGVTDVFVMGGNVAVGDDVVQQIQNTVSVDCSGANRRTPEDQDVHIRAQRIAGPDRFGTARAAGLFVFGGNTVGRLNLSDDPSLPTLRTAIIANGRNFPDAMVAGPMAFSGKALDCGFGADCNGYPILETDAGASTLPPATQTFMTERNIEQVLIVGGTDAVPQAIEDSLTAQGINVVRLSGANRQQTAIEVAKFEYQRLLFGIQCCPGPSGHVALARGDFFTDALALGPRAGAVDEPILLTQDPSTTGADTDGFLTTLSKDFFDPNLGGEQNFFAGGFNPPANAFQYSVFHLEVAGGTLAISLAAENEALNALIGA